MWGPKVCILSHKGIWCHISGSHFLESCFGQFFATLKDHYPKPWKTEVEFDASRCRSGGVQQDDSRDWRYTKYWGPAGNSVDLCCSVILETMRKNWGISFLDFGPPNQGVTSYLPICAWTIGHLYLPALGSRALSGCVSWTGFLCTQRAAQVVVQVELAAEDGCSCQFGSFHEGAMKKAASRGLKKGFFIARSLANGWSQVEEHPKGWTKCAKLGTSADHATGFSDPRVHVRPAFVSREWEWIRPAPRQRNVVLQTTKPWAEATLGVQETLLLRLHGLEQRGRQPRPPCSRYKVQRNTKI